MNNIFQPDEHNLERAALAVKSGGLVAMPTETVYGLGANVYIAAAVARIFEAKQRPFFDPLISHIAETDFLKTYARTDERIMALARKFWPGPLTMVLKRSDNNAAIDLACSGLPNIAVRMPAHPVALDLIKKSGVPIVAPSANKFKSISPTTAQHVFDSLGDKVDMILDGGPCAVGVESTIIDVTAQMWSFCAPAAHQKKIWKNSSTRKFCFRRAIPTSPALPDSCSNIMPPTTRCA